ncbi:GL16020 [Drosophila persimilis]|uniref:GL16020 n=1 Tax=Drosophila persimilis TaxID=7234 RepID=B4H9Y4_DROPE|nr:proline-rich receptor-like protein kinase PERK9 isoform X1 [Drosophila persimilis]EDW36641.1 GL16020 [Drosophila persimilis]
MLRQICLVLLLVALGLGPARSHAMTPQVSTTRSEIEESELRVKRGTVTVDFGLVLRNLLLKSAQFSNAKADKVKATTSRPRKTTTTTTAPPVQPPAPPPPPPPPRQRPVLQPHGYYSFGYLPFDYETDYEDALGKAPPQSGLARRPLRPLYLQRKSPGPALAARYEADYDYDAPPPPKQVPPAPSLPNRPAPRRRTGPRPQPRQPLPQPQTKTQTRRPAAELNDRLVYQYAQSTDTYYRPSVVGGGVAAQVGPVEAGPEDAPDGENEDDDGTDATAPVDNYNGADVDGNSGADLPWFVVNYANEYDSADFSRESSESSLAQPPRDGIPVKSSGYVYRDPIS